MEDHIFQWENLLPDTPSKWFERVWLYVQAPASASCRLRLTGHPLEVFGSKAMAPPRGSRQRRHYLELLQVCRQDKLITGNQRRNVREKETQIK